MLNKLPVDIVINIIQYLEIRDRNHLMETCTHLRDLFSNNAICWTHLNFRPYHSISENTLLRLINRYLLPRHFPDNNKAIKIKCVVFLDLSGCQYLSSGFICWMLSLFTGLRELKLNQFGSPKIIDNRVTDSFHSMTLESSFGLSPYNIQYPALRVCDSTPDTAAKFILLQTELAKPKNQFYEVQENKIVYKPPHGRIGLDISFRELGGVLKNLTQLKTLCLHHKFIGPDDNVSCIYQLKKLKELDLSFCHIELSVFTLLIKTMIFQLTTLKLMYVNIAESQLNVIKEHGTNLECLHLSCGFRLASSNNIMAAIGDTIGNLPKLIEFKLYSQGSESFDNIMPKLNFRTIQKLDISAYDKTICKISQASISSLETLPRGAILPHQGHRPTGVALTKNGIANIAYCTHLTELRLGYIILHDDSLSILYQYLHLLEVLELRYCESNSILNSSSRSISKKLLVGIDKLTRLRELHLYSVTVHTFSIDSINNIKSLEYLTFYDCGIMVESSSAVKFWLTHMKKLKILVLSRLSKPTSLWLAYNDLIFPENKEDYHNVIFKRLCYTSTWRII